MADEFVLPEDIGGVIDCSDIQPWDRKSLRYDYILKATTGDSDYPIVPEEVGICTDLWVHGNAQIDNIQINQTITGNPDSYLGTVTADRVGIGTTNPLGTLQVGTASSTFIVTGIGSVGIGTSIPTSKLHVVGNTLITGITTVGLGTTSSPSNSQLTFELTSDTNLRVRVRGTDGVIRSTNLTLS